MMHLPRSARFLFGVALATRLTITAPARAQWQPNGVPVCAASGEQTKPVVVADGSGGAYVVWEDARGADPQVYAQHLDALGVPRWGMNGILVSSGSYSQYGPVAVGDGEGGVIVAWILSLVPGAYEGRGQRLSSAGSSYWSDGGIPITPGAAFPTKLAIIGDGRTPDILGSAGAILAWTDLRSGLTTDIYTEAISGSGVQRWGAAVCTATGNQTDLCMATDSYSNIQGQPRGAIVAWRDHRAGASDPDIYAQRIDYTGAPVWTANGVDLAPGITTVREPSIVPAGSQTAIVCWPGPAASRTFGLYADRVGTAGSWGGPVPLTNPNSGQLEQAVITDGAGGIIATWQQPGVNLTRDVYAQRLDATGVPQWGATGTLVCVSSAFERNPVIVPGRSGGSVIAWLDSRNETSGDVYSQLLDANGTRQWIPEGTPLCRALGTQSELSASADTTGGAIVAWTDYRSGNADIYAQRVTGQGAVTGVDAIVASTLTLSRPWPSPSRSGVSLAFDQPAASVVSATVFDAAGRRVRTLLAGMTYTAGRHTLAWDSRNEDGEPAPNGVYWISIGTSGAQYSQRAVIVR